jgi:diguanylate cyclase (GGDEF)-like protein
VRKNRFILLFATIASLAILYNLFFAYDQLRRVEKLQVFVARHQAQVLDAFLMAFRHTYQEVFIENEIPLNEQSVQLLPVLTTPCITEKFSNILAKKAEIRVVSDNPRNPKNMANALEMRSIDHFRTHPNQKEWYTLIEEHGEQRFFYTTPIYIEKQCLACHGKREEAPTYIRTHYDKAYGYRLGELRGIIGIYLSQSSLRESVKKLMLENIAKMAIITLLFLVVFYFLLKRIYRKEDAYTQTLEREVAKKTEAIRRQSHELAHRLYHDPLTDLPNRNALIRDIANLERGTLILINIDDFKEINDFYGHETGDRLILALAKLLEQKRPDQECRLYRMPSDEFALLFHWPMPQNALYRFLEALVRTVDDADFQIDEKSVVHLRIAAGASSHHTDLLITADMAIKQAKAERKPFVIYDDTIDLSGRYQRNLEWAERLKRALEGERIVPYFQPIVDVRNRQVRIYEALVRLIDEKGVVHPPVHFLDIAKRTKYYPELTKRMVDQAFLFLEKTPHEVSLNISYLDIVNKETMQYIIDKMALSGLGRRIHFEVLESEGIERYDEVFECLARLKTHGAHISLDDFGSGYSNFEHILKLDVDMLKIDGSLIRQIDTDESAQIIVATIVDFARKLGIDTCAEFVHSPAVLATVTKLGVTYVQGYHLGEPRAMRDLV